MTATTFLLASWHTPIQTEQPQRQRQQRWRHCHNTSTTTVSPSIITVTNSNTELSIGIVVQNVYAINRSCIQMIHKSTSTQSYSIISRIISKFVMNYGTLQYKPNNNNNNNDDDIVKSQIQTQHNHQLLPLWIVILSSITVLSFRMIMYDK